MPYNRFIPRKGDDYPKLATKFRKTKEYERDLQSTIKSTQASTSTYQTQTELQMTTLVTEKVIDRIEEFCRVLRTNYQESAITLHRNYINKEENVDYHIEQINQLAMGEGVDEFVYTKGKKYAKIIHITQPSGQRSAHAFVDLNTGDVMKSASWKTPAKGVRYNLMDDKSREEMYKRADFAGGYLYAR